MTNLTSTRLATIISRSFDLDKLGKTRIHRVLRNFVTKDFVDSALDGHDERGTKLLNLNNAAVAVLLLPMADMAVDARALREVSNYLRTLNTGFPKTPIERLLNAAREGREGKVVVEVNWNAGTGQIRRSIRVEIEGNEPNDDVKQIMADYKEIMIENLSNMEVPTTRLLSFLLEAVE